MHFVLLFTTLAGLLSVIKGQISSISISRITPSDIVNGGTICPNIHLVEVTCVGIEVTFLQWQRNGSSIGGGFTVVSDMSAVQPVDPFTLILDSITRRNTVANMTSRLIANISNLISGDRIGCTAVGMQDTRTLNFKLRGRPPEVPTNFSVSIDTNGATVDISITWDSDFNLAHTVSSYRVVSGGGSAASCPSSCDPSGPCKCTGLGIGEDTTIFITAINCGNQMGMPLEVIARPQVPASPSECSALPAYNSTGDLSAVDLTWTTVSNSPEFLPGISQDVTSYFIRVGMMDSMTIPASTACSTSTCFHSYSVQSLNDFNSPLAASVSAVNVIGRGPVCTPQTEIGTRNEIFSLTLDTTNIGNQTVACSGEAETFKCEFCFTTGDTCQNLACIPATGTPTLLPSLTELTYCYRATASVNGIAVAVIQDTFNTSCPLDVLGTAIDNSSNRGCSSDSLSIPHGLGCYNGQNKGAVAYYQCDKWYTLSGDSRRMCMGDGNWDGKVPECRVNRRNITLLVLSIPTWVLSIILTVIAAITLRKEILCKQWLKITCRSCTVIVLLTTEGALLLLVLLLWIVFSRINSEPQQTSLLISAFVLALPWTVVALVVLHIASRCSTDNPSHRADNIEKSDPNTSSNAAYGIARRVEGAEEIVYTYPEMNFDSTIEAKQNEAYATNIITQGNEAYATTAAL